MPSKYGIQWYGFQYWFDQSAWKGVADECNDWLDVIGAQVTAGGQAGCFSICFIKNLISIDRSTLIVQHARCKLFDSIGFQMYRSFHYVVANLSPALPCSTGSYPLPITHLPKMLTKNLQRSAVMTPPPLFDNVPNRCFPLTGSLKQHTADERRPVSELKWDTAAKTFVDSQL